MDFIEIREILGGSILPDEYRGSYEEAERQISALEREILAGASPITQRAKTILLRGIYYMLSGDFPKAREYNQSLTDLQHQGLDQSWILRSQMYGFYGAMLQYRLPLIQFAMIPGDPFEALREGASYLKDMHLQAKRAGLAISSAQSASVVEMLEQAMILDMWSFLDTLHFSYLAHPNFTPLVTVQSLPQDRLGDLRFDNMQVPYLSSTLADFMRQSGNPMFKNTLQRMSMDIDSAKGSANRGQDLTQLESEYENAADYAGMGLCKMNEGDRLLSPSYTSPIALNLICQVRENGKGNHDKAQECYSEALFYMEVVCAPRGQAAVYLRRDCVNHAEGIRSKARAGSEQFLQAEKELSTALKLFAKDNLNEQLVTCHHILLGCSRGTSAMAVDSARRLGTELRRTQSSAMSHFLGALMLRFAHSQFLLHGNVRVAATSCQCAAVYYEALDDPLGALWAAEAYITLLKRTHDWTLAEAKIRETIKSSGVLQNAFAYIGQLVSWSQPPASPSPKGFHPARI
ncbi:hypothetical protein BDW59DRAFT_162931 [Aspergillus cavernicola]|uniref:Uncharacterized protein n=1 Tax=Aspergillus cavernicola TaxID=176166 RepID=A0ABR4I7N3_9EURO